MANDGALSLTLEGLDDPLANAFRQNSVSLIADRWIDDSGSALPRFNGMVRIGQWPLALPVPLGKYTPPGHLSSKHRPIVLMRFGSGGTPDNRTDRSLKDLVRQRQESDWMLPRRLNDSFEANVILVGKLFDRAEKAARGIYPLHKRLEDTPWKGARPCAPDMVPVMGPAPRHKGLWFAFGHAHHGLTMAASTGRLLSELMTGETPFANPAPFSPARFG